MTSFILATLKFNVKLTYKKMRRFSIVLIMCVLASSLVFHSCDMGNKQKGSQAIFENSDQMVEAAKKVITQIKPEDLKAIYNGDEYLVIIDVRAKEEYNAGYIPGAVNITRGMLEFQIAKEEVWDNLGLYIPEKGDNIILCCRTGSRSALAAQTLQMLGYTNVKSVEGGWTAWHQAFPDLIEKIEVAAPVGGEPAAAKPASGGGGC